MSRLSNSQKIDKSNYAAPAAMEGVRQLLTSQGSPELPIDSPVGGAAGAAGGVAGANPYGPAIEAGIGLAAGAMDPGGGDQNRSGSIAGAYTTGNKVFNIGSAGARLDGGTSEASATQKIAEGSAAGLNIWVVVGIAGAAVLGVIVWATKRKGR